MWEERLKEKQFDASHYANCCSCEPVDHQDSLSSFAILVDDAIPLINSLLKEQREKIKGDVFTSLENYWVWNQMEIQVKNLLTEAIFIGIDAPPPEGEVK